MQKLRYHLIVDLSDIASNQLADEPGLKNFISDLADEIEMRIIYGPIVQAGIPENPGLSAFAIIDYSHISVHTFTDTREVLIDIFSCKPYRQSDALQAVLGYFKAKPTQARIQVVCWEK